MKKWWGTNWVGMNVPLNLKPLIDPFEGENGNVFVARNLTTAESRQLEEAAHLFPARVSWRSWFPPVRPHSQGSDYASHVRLAIEMFFWDKPEQWSDLMGWLNKLVAQSISPKVLKQGQAVEVVTGPLKGSRGYIRNEVRLYQGQGESEPTGAWSVQVCGTDPHEWQEWTLRAEYLRPLPE